MRIGSWTRVPYQQPGATNQAAPFIYMERVVANSLRHAEQSINTTLTNFAPQG